MHTCISGQISYMYLGPTVLKIALTFRLSIRDLCCYLPATCLLNCFKIEALLQFYTCTWTFAQQNLTLWLLFALHRGMVDASGDQFVAYFLPTTDTIRKRKNHNRSLWRRKEIVRAALNKKKYRSRLT